MFTIVTVPFPWASTTGIHQHNSLSTWVRLEPRPEIIMLCDEEGTARAARQYGARHVKDVRLTSPGYPSIQHILQLADEHATHDTIAYVDTDVLLLSDFPPMVEYVAAHYTDYCVNTGRYDIRLNTPVDFTGDWEERLVASIFRYHNHGSDYCVYPRGFFPDFPNFSIGAGAWDGWRMGYALQHGTLINAEHITHALHQKHRSRWRRHPAREYNQELAGPFSTRAWVNNATVYLTKEMLCSSQS